VREHDRRRTLLSLWGRAASAILGLLAATYVAYAVVGLMAPGSAIAFPGSAAAGWFALAGVVVVVEAAALYASLPKNRRIATDGGAAVSDASVGGGTERPVLRGLGGANVVTLARGTLFAWTAGFLAVPLVGPVAWLPAATYAAGAALDAVDGAVARATGRVTALGRDLDAEFDGLGLLVATLVGVTASHLSPLYLVAGLTRYAWLAAVWVRRRRGLAVGPLPDRPRRRLLAGLQMLFVAAALTPVTGPTFGLVGSVVVGGPFVAGFVRDWLYVTGRRSESA
jgi:CDP-diacylglycerol--glycerol-3-phosphate 3-phosphatidyltransferase